MNKSNSLLIIALSIGGNEMAKKLKVDDDMCIGCGLCVGSHPTVFEFNDDGKATVVAEADDAEAEDAIANCPVQAISEN